MEWDWIGWGDTRHGTILNNHQKTRRNFVGVAICFFFCKFFANGATNKRTLQFESLIEFIRGRVRVSLAVCAGCCVRLLLHLWPICKFLSKWMWRNAKLIKVRRQRAKESAIMKWEFRQANGRNACLIRWQSNGISNAKKMEEKKYAANEHRTNFFCRLLLLTFILIGSLCADRYDVMMVSNERRVVGRAEPTTKSDSICEIADARRKKIGSNSSGQQQQRPKIRVTP